MHYYRPALGLELRVPYGSFPEAIRSIERYPWMDYAELSVTSTAPVLRCIALYATCPRLFHALAPSPPRIAILPAYVVITRLQYLT